MSGTLTTRGWLRGTTHFVTRTMTMVEGSPEIAYTGELTVTLPNGDTVVFESSGTIDAATGTFTETDVPSGVEKGGSLTISGTTNPTLTAFRGEISGQLCGVDHPTGR